MTARVPASLRLTVPLIVLGFAAVLSAVNVLYHVPRVERAVEESVYQRVAQETSRLQSTLEYLLLKGNLEVAQREIAVLAHNHDYVFVVLTNDQREVIASTRRAWLQRKITDVLPDFDLEQASGAIRERRARLAIDATGNAVHGYAGILMGSHREELRPSLAGSLLLAHDLARPKAEARAQVLQQALYWAGWVTALALVMWLAFHFLLTRRTAQLVRAAEQFAAGDLTARSALRGRDELARLSRAFDTMATQVAETQTRLRQDLAERIRIQRALEDSEASYRSMFNTSIDGLALWNAAGEIVDVNPALLRMYGYGEEAFATLPRGAFLDPAHHPEFLHSLASGEPWHAEFTELRKDGSAIALEVHAIPMRHQGTPQLLSIARDVTEKKRAAEELARQRETLHQREKLAALGSLLAGVAHELNNPLSVVVARAVMLEEANDPSTQLAAQKIRAAAERCARIVRTFLAMARQQQPERGPVAINDTISAALDITAYAVRTSSIEVTLELADALPYILADADQLHQVLLNLIINAQQVLQDAPMPRRIGVTTRFDSAADKVLITVADNGPGIPEHLRARVFEPYFTTKPVGVGTGVGLAVSFGIIEAHGGRLTLECPPEGGTAFHIELPVGAADSAVARANDPAAIPVSQHEILVVDDEAEIREVLTDILRSAGNHVVEASSGREALERMQAHHFDVILTDVRMPDLDGLTLYQEIERRWPERANVVVFVTGDTLSASSRELVDVGNRPVIEKPFVPEEVHRIVAEVALTGALGGRS